MTTHMQRLTRFCSSTSTWLATAALATFATYAQATDTHDDHAHGAAATGLKAALVDPTVVNYAFTPHVITTATTGEIRLSVRVTGPAPTSLKLTSEWGTVYDLVDTGTGGDLTAGDGIYSANLPVQPILQRRVDSDVGRVFLGFLDPYVGTTRLGRSNVFAQVRTSDMSTVNVRTLAADAQMSQHVLNITLPSTFHTHDETTPAIDKVVQAAARYLTNEFDFVNVVFARSQIENRYHFATQNKVTGIGNVNVFDVTAQYGGLTRLLGISVFPSHTFFDGANFGHQHELGHQWIAFLKNAELSLGSPHWPSSTMAFDLMGQSTAGSSQGGAFQCKLTPEGNGLRTAFSDVYKAAVFNPLDLYLMGLMPASEVPDQWVITDPTFAANWGTMCDGRLLTTGFSRLTISDVITVNGPRVPDYSSTQRTFRVATVVVSDGLLSPDAMSFFDYFAKRMEARERVAVTDGRIKAPGAPFFVATGGRGALNATVDPTVTVPTRVTATEYLHAQLNYYFLTSRDNEKALLDVAPGWSRTGASFNMFAYPDASLNANVRFYFDQIAKNGLRGSHFYTVSPADVAALQALNPTNAAAPRLPVNEGVDSYGYRPIGSGVSAVCPSGTTPVYRLFRGNARFPDDPNHRFTTSKTVYDQFVAAGWDGEGINICAP